VKVDRKKVHEKYGGKCAYCGTTLDIKKFQVDHITPQRLNLPDSNNNKNLNPACFECNNFKTGMPNIEEFRSELQKQVFRLKNNTQFKRALKFGQIKITESPIKFQYEKGGER
jgi:5-methylcytosine-specific restriction endonuclease McrA